MDPLTHAASGAIAMLALPVRPQTWWALPIAALACASPDLDLLFIHSPASFLLLHRGISHSLAAVPFFGLILALCSWPLWRKATPGRWPFLWVWLFSMTMLLLHVWLDIFTTYGTMIFLPFSHYRVRLDSLYIIDPLLALPLFGALIFWRAKRRAILFVLAWCLIYPVIGLGLNVAHTIRNEQRLLSENREVSHLRVLPDIFAPFFWRLLYFEKAPTGHFICEQSLDALGKPRNLPEPHPAAPPELMRRMSALSKDADIYFQFALLPVMTDLPAKFQPDESAPHASFHLFYDLRFGSGLKFMRRLLALRPNADMPFLLMAEIAPQEEWGVLWATDWNTASLSRLRLRFSDSGRDSDWHVPKKPRNPDFLQWLAGLK